MGYADIVAEISTLAYEVTGVVNVYTGKASYNEQSEFDTLFLDEANDRVLGFEIYRTSFEEEQDNFNSYRDEFTVMIHGFIGIKHATDGSDSYTTLQTLMDNLHNKFRRNRTVNGTALNSEPPTMNELTQELRMGAWCWGAQIEWVIHERTTFTESIS